MPTRRIDAERLSLISRKPFQHGLAALDEAVGHPDMNAFRNSVGAATTFSELERVIQAAIGPSGFMEFIRFDHGEVVHKVKGGRVPGIVRLVIGNPLIMKQMVQPLPDAGSNAPVTFSSTSVRTAFIFPMTDWRTFWLRTEIQRRRKWLSNLMRRSKPYSLRPPLERRTAEAGEKRLEY